MTESTDLGAADPGETPAPSQSSPPRRSRRLLWWTGIAIAALIVAGIVAFAVIGRSDDDKRVGGCVKETAFVSCDSAHDARIVAVVDKVNDCPATSTHALKDGARYYCLLEEVG